MDKSVTTEKDLGVTTPCGPDGKFRNSRHKAKEAENERSIKGRRDRRIPEPKHKVGESIVVISGRYIKGARHYELIEVVDVQENRGYEGRYIYYGLIIKVTDPSSLPLVGRPGHFTEQGYYDRTAANVAPEGIKWLEPPL